MAQQKRRPNTMVYGNLAYDLDTLASQRQLEEAARPERQSQPQQAPRHRTAARPRQRVSPLALCAVGALAAMAVVLVMGYIQLTAVTGSISDLQEQVSQLEDQRVSRRLVGEGLTPREADVIRRRYGLDGHPPQTQRQVAAAYGISRSYVSRIEKRALEKLEAALREHCYP